MTDTVTQARRVVLYRQNKPSRVTKVGRIVLYTPIEPPLAEDAPPIAFSLIPETPVRELWEWLTAVNTALTGDEQRAILRATPRIKFNMQFVITNDADREAYYAYLMRYFKTNFLFPLHAYAAKLKQPAALAATRIYFNRNWTDIRAGEDIAFYDPHTEAVSFGKVTTMESDGANVEALPQAYGAHCQVMPALLFRFPRGAGMSMQRVHGDLVMNIEAVPVRGLRRPGVADQITVISDLGDALPLLDRRPLTDAEEAFDQNIEWVDNRVSPPTFATQWKHPKIGGKRAFKVQNLSDLDYWREFLDRVKGQQKGFLAPTFRNDLTLVEPPTLGGTTLTITNLDFFDQLGFKTYRRLRIVTANGVLIRRITGRSYVYDDGVPVAVRLGLDAAFGGSAGDNDIRLISFLNVCRVTDDAIEIEHLSHSKIISFGWQTTDA